MIKRAILTLTLVVFGIVALMANTPVVKKRQVKQSKRIVGGVHSGELTKTETLQLRQQQIHIQQVKNRAKADGVVTKKEKAIIHQKQNQANRNIYRKKHNNRSR
jgi:hypothetical protein